VTGPQEPYKTPQNRLDHAAPADYVPCPNVSCASSHFCERSGSSTGRRRGLSRLTKDFDKNPRLATVVGFFAPAIRAAAKP